MDHDGGRGGALIGSDPVTMDVADDNQDAAGGGLAKWEEYSDEEYKSN